MTAPPSRIARGTVAFRRTNLALFSAGFSTFTLMYCVQPLLPAFAREFQLTPAAASLAVSITAGCLAVSLLVVGALSEVWGRKPVMVTSLSVAALLTVASAFTSAWPAFLVIRAIEGIAFAGLPALAMAYVGEEMDSGAVGAAMGLYVGGTALGGMTGRLLTAALADLVSWRFAVAGIGLLGMAAAAIFATSLPRSSHFRPRDLHPGMLARAYLRQLRDPVLAGLFAEGFLYMGAFVTVYNYIGFRLQAPPYALSQTATGFVFSLYLIGTFSSSWAGARATRLGRAPTLTLCLVVMATGLAVTMLSPLPAIVAGLGLLSFGFFGSHTVASSWVGFRAHDHKAQASSLYLFSYYLGASLTGATGGWFWTAFGWPGVVGFLAVLLGLALAVSRGLARAA